MTKVNAKLHKKNISIGKYSHYQKRCAKSLKNLALALVSQGLLPTQGLIKTLGSMVIFDENQGVSDLSKYEFLCPIYVKIIKFLVI